MSPLLGGKNAEVCKQTRIEGLGKQSINRISMKVIDRVTSSPNYAGIIVTGIEVVSTKSIKTNENKDM